MSKMITEALYYARRGWFVFPTRERPGEPFLINGETVIQGEKSPYTADGLDSATREEEQIKTWWNMWPNAMIGVNAGKSGLFVIDIDRKKVNGLDTFKSWNINDSAGLHSMTPSGGMHIIFSGIGKTSSNSKTGIDTRGEGGYFVVPPSKIINGKYPGEYTAFDDWTRDPGVIPDGLMSNLFPSKTIEYVRGNTSLPISSSEKKQLSRATLNFFAEGAPEGERNTTLFKVIADFAGCGYSQQEVRDAVMPVCVRIGLSGGEFEQVMSHAFSKPRTSSIPDEIQIKIAEGGKNIASKITPEEQSVLETVLLACLLISNDLIPVIADILSFDDFSAIKNRVIYKAINRLYDSSMKVDFFTTSDEVGKETDKISLDDISKIINDYYVNLDNAQTYARIIKEKASIRKIEALMTNRNKYLKEDNLVSMINVLEKDISDIALYGGVKSTNVLDSKQATEMVKERTRMLINGEIEQLKTGFYEYDYHVGGLYSNELVVLAGRSGDGKSSLSMSIVNDIAITQNKAVALFSLEMSTHEGICRLVCQLTGIPFKKVYQGKMTEQEWKLYSDAMDKISSSKIYFDDGFGMTVPEIRSKIRKLMDNNIKLVVIDQLEQIKGYEGMPAYIQFDKITYDIKNLTKEFDIPIILNHQLNRGITDRKLKNPEPQLSDLNQAGEKPANQVWVISHKKDEKGRILQSKVKVLKNRNGPRIEFAVIFLADRMLFANPSCEQEREVFNSTIDANIDDDDSD